MSHHPSPLFLVPRPLCPNWTLHRPFLLAIIALLVFIGSALNDRAQGALTTLTGDDLKRDVSRFLTQATFGPTNAEIQALYNTINNDPLHDRAAAYSNWIDAQFNLPQTSIYQLAKAMDQYEFNRVQGLYSPDIDLYNRHAPLDYDAHNDPGTINRRHAWWTACIFGKDQLRQRVAFALSEIFVASTGDGTLGNYQYGLCAYYDTLGNYADKNFKDLLKQVSIHPVMGQYLSSLQNRKYTTKVLTNSGVVTTNIIASPDENYAREVMQLFTIGLDQLNDDGSLAGGVQTATYTNADVSELARVFTGWSFSYADSPNTAPSTLIANTNFLASPGNRFYQSSWLYPMTNFGSTYHDDGPKTFLGHTISLNHEDGDTDLNSALSVLFNHPNTPPFICLRLIQRLVTSNPTPQYLTRVVHAFQNNGSNQRGDMKAVIKAILLDGDAREFIKADNFYFGKQKEPLLRYMQIVRAAGGQSAIPIGVINNLGANMAYTQPNNFSFGATILRHPGSTDTLGQTPFEQPSVFNWFSPFYRPSTVYNGAATNSFPAGYVAPEMQLTTAPQLYGTMNSMRLLTMIPGKQGDKFLDGYTNASGTHINATPPYTNAAGVVMSPDIVLDVTEYQAIYHTAYSGNNPAYTDPDPVTNGINAALDYMDLVLLSGELKRKYATAAQPNPRSVIFDAIKAQSFPVAPPGYNSNIADAEKDRMREMLWLISCSASYIHQK